MISRCRDRKAIAKGVERAAAEIEIKLRANPGYKAQNACAVIPPMDGPMTTARDLSPRLLTTSKPPRATSSSASTGNRNRYGSPVAGSTDAGPLDPKQLPRELTQMTNQRWVSIGRPGPIMSSHHPGVLSSGDEAACAEGE